MNLDEMPILTPSEMRAYELKARELRSEAAGELVRATGKRIAGLFRKLSFGLHRAGHA